jgi:S1-C subfamily serine protease
MPRSPLPMEQTGARLLGVAPDGPAGRAGLRAGDVIIAVDGVPIDGNHPLTDVIRGRKPGDVVVIIALRSGAKLTVNVTLGSQPLPNGQTVAFLDVSYDTWPPPGRAN